MFESDHRQFYIKKTHFKNGFVFPSILMIYKEKLIAMLALKGVFYGLESLIRYLESSSFNNRFHLSQHRLSITGWTSTLRLMI